MAWPNMDRRKMSKMMTFKIRVMEGESKYLQNCVRLILRTFLL